MSRSILGILLCLASIVFAGCGSITCYDPSEKREGSSFLSAVIVRASAQAEGVEEEHQWLSDHFPGWRPCVTSQSEEADGLIVFAHVTSFFEGRPYSVHCVQLKDGSRRTVYFDISNYFGK